MSTENLLEILQRNFSDASSKDVDGGDVPIQMPQIRFRPPYLQTCKHDARGDALNLALDFLLQKEVPLWAANLLSFSFVDSCYAEKLHTEKVTFSEHVYDAINAAEWSRNVMKCLNEFLHAYVNGDQPIPEKPKEWDQYLYSVCAQKNRKPKMEDKHIVLPTLAIVEPQINHVNYAKAVFIEHLNENGFFAVFDGHHGAECALYASSHFHLCLLDEIANKTEDNDATLMERTFKLFDRRLTIRCENEKIRSGTTAVGAYLKKNVVYLGWCGDSSIGVLNSNEVVTLSKRHTPNDEDEVKRIEEAGGMVVWIQGERRVNGVLNVSRSLGDIQGKPMISSEPDTRVYELSDDDYILFLASDGVWDTLPEESVYDAVRKFIVNNNIEDYQKMAQFIVEESKEEGASDNLTLICVFLVPLDRLWKLFS